MPPRLLDLGVRGRVVVLVVIGVEVRDGDVCVSPPSLRGVNHGFVPLEETELWVGDGCLTSCSTVVSTSALRGNVFSGNVGTCAFAGGFGAGGGADFAS